MTDKHEEEIKEILSLDRKYMELVHVNEKLAMELIKVNYEELHLQEQIDKLDNAIILNKHEDDRYLDDIKEFEIYRIFYNDMTVENIKSYDENISLSKSYNKWFMLNNI